MPTAIVSGATGQDGSYLSELLLERKYKVVGIVRRVSSEAKALWRLTNCLRNNSFVVEEGDISEPVFVASLVQKYTPEEFYNLAAQSHVQYSFENPLSTLHVNACGPANILYALEKYSKHTKFYQASTSEIYGGFPATSPQDESTPFKPQSPYGIAKLAAHHLVRLARDRGLFACAGILFNHESPRRGEKFVTQKIVTHAIQVAHGLRDKIRLGNLSAKRDWGYAPEYVEGMWRMLQHPVPDDYVLATGTTWSVGDFLMYILKKCNLSLEKHVEIDDSMKRPNEVAVLCGNYSKARNELDWKPTVMKEKLADIMIEAALKSV